MSKSFGPLLGWSSARFGKVVHQGDLPPSILGYIHKACVPFSGPDIVSVHDVGQFVDDGFATENGDAVGQDMF
jgi:hypothetical protein